MEIKGLKDLEIVKNALENYVTNTEKMVKIMQNELPQPLIENLEKQIFRGKELIENVNNEFNDVLHQKIQELTET